MHVCDISYYNFDCTPPPPYKKIKLERWYHFNVKLFWCLHKWFPAKLCTSGSFILIRASCNLFFLNLWSQGYSDGICFRKFDGDSLAFYRIYKKKLTLQKSEFLWDMILQNWNIYLVRLTDFLNQMLQLKVDFKI